MPHQAITDLENHLKLHIIQHRQLLIKTLTIEANLVSLAARVDERQLNTYKFIIGTAAAIVTGLISIGIAISLKL